MKIYNTMNRQKEDFVPIEPGKVRMYTCGQTVYNDIHMGNARFYVVYDAIRRWLEYRGYDVTFVQNFTDIEDKIIQKANDEHVSSEVIAEKYIAHTLEDLKTLNVLPATYNPRATDEVPEIISMIEHLIHKGFAYEYHGEVFYDVSQYHEYGKLSKKNIDELEAGDRAEKREGKRNDADFVLWKPAKPGEPKWESPWSAGRPGWHIECSAMVRKYLGDTIDIHGGGSDLIFPHHENEIAQSEAVTGKTFAHYWMHTGMLTADHKKMSKSRGNFFTFREMTEKFSPEVLRFYLLSGHYRMPMEFTDAVLEAAQAGLTRIKNSHHNLVHAMQTHKDTATQDKPLHLDITETFRRDFEKAMDDDFNTADAITVIFELVKYINNEIASSEPSSQLLYQNLLDELISLTGILGITLSEPVADDDNAEIDALIEARQNARKNKDFAAADDIRDRLTQMGIIIEDTAGGVRWRRV